MAGSRFPPVSAGSGLAHGHSWTCKGARKIKIELVRPQWLGRFRYYNNHLDDATRFTFRIGLWGLLLGAASIFLSAAGFLKFP